MRRRRRRRRTTVINLTTLTWQVGKKQALLLILVGSYGDCMGLCMLPL